MDNTLWAVLIGGLLTGIPTIISTFLNNRHSRRNTFDETAFDIGIKAWEAHCRMADDYAARGYKATVGDIQSYIIYSVLVMNAASKGNMSRKKARRTMEDIHAVMGIVDEFAAKRISGEIKEAEQGGDGDAEEAV